MKKSNVRLSVDVSNELNNLLETMAKDTNSTKSDVLRKSIALFEVAVKEKKNNHHLGVFDEKNKMIKEIIGI